MNTGDFIEVYPDVLPREACRDLLARFSASNQLQPGRVGSGVMPELKDSLDLGISDKTAKSRLFAARRRLQSALEAEDR